MGPVDGAWYIVRGGKMYGWMKRVLIMLPKCQHIHSLKQRKSISSLIRGPFWLLRLGHSFPVESSKSTKALSEKNSYLFLKSQTWVSQSLTLQKPWDLACASGHVSHMKGNVFSIHLCLCANAACFYKIPIPLLHIVVPANIYGAPLCSALNT